jgi:ankyrin repeat protein
MGTTKSKFMDAIKTGNINTVQRLIKNEDININQTDEYGDTPLIYAVRHNMTEIIKFLLLLEADYFIKNKKGESVFSLEKGKDILYPYFRVAIITRNIKKTKLFLEHGIDINQKDKSGDTPLIYVIKYNDLVNYNTAGYIQFLLKSGADINIKDKNGKTAFDIALKNKDKLFLNILINEIKERNELNELILYSILEDKDKHEYNIDDEDNIIRYILMYLS